MLPNIVFVILDTFRGDKISKIGKGTNLTPFMQNLLNKSINFENCIANSPWTLPSHINMFTGLFSSQNALISNDLEKVASKIPLLPEIMRDMGYYTMGYIENPWVSDLFGLTRGFDKCFSNDVWTNSFWNRERYPFSFLFKIINILNSKLRKTARFNIIRKIWSYLYAIVIRLIKDINLFTLKVRIYYKLKDNSIANLERLSRILNNSKEKKPVFFFFNFLTTHDPYIPLVINSKLSNISSEDIRVIKDMIINPIKYRVEIDLNSKRLLEKETKIIEKLYNSCVFSADLVINKLFKVLRKLKILENSYIIITSDHGEHLGGKKDHYLWEHSTYYGLYEEVLRVPLIIYNHSFNQKTVSDQVQLKDLFHTILDLTGKDFSDSYYFDKNKSILYQIETNSTPKYIYGEYIKSIREFHLVAPYLKQSDYDLLRKIKNDLYFLRTNEYKYISHKNLDIDELYKLDKDPHELDNISSVNHEKMQEMRSILKKIQNSIKNVEGFKKDLTKKEQDSIKKIIEGKKFKKI